MSKLEEAIERLKSGKKMDLISVLRTFKREGIENFAITRKEDLETVLEELNKATKGDIKELPELTSHINYDTYSIENNRHKINELVRAVNKMRKILKRR